MIINAVHARLEVQADAKREQELAAGSAMARSKATQPVPDQLQSPGDTEKDAGTSTGKRRKRGANVSSTKGASEPRSQKRGAAKNIKSGNGAGNQLPASTISAEAQSAQKSVGSTLRDRLKALGVRAEVEDI